MSCFRGRMREYTSVSLDRFDGINNQSTVFFLSHCHKDHMVGLELPAFHQKLGSRNDVFLYCSALTKTLLLADSKYRQLEKFIRVLDVNTPTTVTIPDKGCDIRKSSSVMVTALSAGHCPGSVMFLIEGEEGTVLYTGDFRWETNHAQTLQAFKSGDSVKEIKSLYIDTTFCFEDAFTFPSRNDCVEASSELISKWLGQSQNHVVSISCKAKYGYEHFLQEMFARTGEKVHTSHHKYSVYQQIRELCDVFTTDPTTRIHACDFRSDRSPLSKLPCGFLPDDKRDLQVLVLRPSTMFFALQRPQYHHNDLVVYPKGPRGLHRVCYSFHSSYVEIRDLVMFLRPKRVFPNVKPPNEVDMTKVQARLNSFLNILHLNHVPSQVAPNSVLGKLKVRRKFNKAPEWSQSDSEGLVFDSPVRTEPRQTVPKQETPTKDPCSQDSLASVNGETPAKSEVSAADSSYQGSAVDDEEMDLTNSQSDTGLLVPPLSTPELMGSEGGGDTVVATDDTQDSYCLYVSGDEDCEEEDRFSKDIYPDNDDVIVIEASLSQDNIDDGNQVQEGGDVDRQASELNKSGTPDKICKEIQKCHRQSEDDSEDKGVCVSETPAVGCRERKTGQVENIVDNEVKNPENTSSQNSNRLMEEGGGGDADTSTKEASAINQCDSSTDKSDKSDLHRTDDSFDISEGIIEIPSSNSRDTGLSAKTVTGNVSANAMEENSGHSSGLSKSKRVDSDRACSSSQISSPTIGTVHKRQGRLNKTGSFDLFDEGHVTDIEDNVTEDIIETQGFDVDLSSDSGVDSRLHRRKYITEIDKEEEQSLREATAQMLLRLQGGRPRPTPAPPPPGEQIVISDSDSDTDTESGFLSGGKDKMNQSDEIRKSVEYARNLNALVSKVEKRLASSDGEFSPRKRLRLDISRNCESDSDVTLPPSQGSYTARFPSCMYYDSSDISESDTDSDAVEILYETDANGAKFDVLGNPMKAEASLVTVCVKHVEQTPGNSSTSEGTDVIDLTEENEEEMEEGKGKSQHLITTHACTEKEKSELPTATQTCTEKEKSELSTTSQACTEKEKSELPCTTKTCTEKEKSELPSATQTCTEKEKSELSSTSQTCTEKEKSELSTTTQTCTEKEKSELPTTSQTCTEKEKSELPTTTKTIGGSDLTTDDVDNTEKKEELGAACS